MLRMRTFLPGLIALAMLLASPVEAAPFVLEYLGTVTSANGVFAGQGALVSGTIHFDENIVDTGAQGNPNRDEFRMSSGANQAFEMFMTIDLGNGSWTTEDNANPPFTLKNIQQFDGPTADGWFFEIPPDSISAGDSEASFAMLIGAGLIVLSHRDLPHSIGVSGQRIGSDDQGRGIRFPVNSILRSGVHTSSSECP